MKTTIDHLLTPRFEVIADYPGSEFEIGTILCQELPSHFSHKKLGKNWVSNVPNIKKYPHLFKKLNWWENRTEEEMPRYLKFDNDKLRLHNRNHFDYFKIDHWNMAALWAMIENGGGHCNLKKFTPSYTYQPCSEEEYLANQ